VKIINLGDSPHYVGTAKEFMNMVGKPQRIIFEYKGAYGAVPMGRIKAIFETFRPFMEYKRLFDIESSRHIIIIHWDTLLELEQGVVKTLKEHFNNKRTDTNPDDGNTS